MQNRDVALNILRAKLVQRAREEQRGQAQRAARRAHGQRVGLADSLLRAAPVSNGEGPCAPTSRPAARKRCSKATSTASSGRICRTATTSRPRPAASPHEACAAGRRRRRLLERQGEDRDRARLGVRAERGARRSGVRERRRLRQRLERRLARVHRRALRRARADRRERREPGLRGGVQPRVRGDLVGVRLPAQSRRRAQGRRAARDRRVHGRAPALRDRRLAHLQLRRQRAAVGRRVRHVGRRVSALERVGRVAAAAPVRQRRGLRDFGYDAPRRVDLAIGAALAIRRATIDEIGPFDERFFLYHEEVDYAKRAADAGWETWFVPASEAVHEGMGSRARPVQRREAQADLAPQVLDQAPRARVVLRPGRRAGRALRAVRRRRSPARSCLGRRLRRR